MQFPKHPCYRSVEFPLIPDIKPVRLFFFNQLPYHLFEQRGDFLRSISVAEKSYLHDLLPLFYKILLYVRIGYIRYFIISD